jgi:hypothetical protein
MTLFSCLLLAFAQPADAATAVVTCPPLLPPPGDNQPILQAFIDSLPLNSAISIPAGTWDVHSTVNQRHKMKGAGMNATIIRAVGVFHGPVIGAGGTGRWPNSVGRPAAENVELSDMTVIADDASNQNNKVVWFEIVTNSWVRRVRAMNGKYEGILVAWKGGGVEDCEAINCGNGGPAYPLGTSGINIGAMGSVIRRCKTRGCAQGIEAGSQIQLIEDNDIAEPGPGSSQIGINIGSVNWGIHDVTIRRNRVRGYESAIGTGNGNGRLSKIYIEDNIVLGGCIGFMGGKPNNLVNLPGEFQGPDLFGSRIVGNFIRAGGAAGTSPIRYTTMPNDVEGWGGREPLVIERNILSRRHRDPNNPGAILPPISGNIIFTGRITAAVVEGHNTIIDSDEAPPWGDINSASFHQSIAVPGFPNLTHSGPARAFRSDDSERAFVKRIEGGK